MKMKKSHSPYNLSVFSTPTDFSRNCSRLVLRNLIPHLSKKGKGVENYVHLSKSLLDNV